ncbi:DUF1513 domain-containing protein [Hydrogenophaga sp.]|uniref:DUF1513 domain-containing protein n=1 Tax=Hydrogenophaga sp. TaxID=1904254 RepID=UPI0025C1FF26|nr:DUF1513 domain-containing protein [Hydrogenophaga sp.]MBT9467313.1 DUF1513 domain-containing protein [Hydrogenophaga sp.]
MTEAHDPLRRRWLGALALGGLLPGFAVATPPGAPAASARLLAAWQSDNDHRIGLIDLGAGQARVHRELLVPTRAHGLLVEAGGSVLAMARRPGDWLVRWHPQSDATQWQWVEDDRHFNGHVVASPDGRTLWTTETDRESGQGRVALRQARTLRKTTEFATLGMDPHEMLVLPQRVGDVPAGSLLVANGGIPSLPETGRAKRDLDRMDASLVALDGGSGRVLGQWRLRDPRLSIRHLAWDPVSACVGIALQAEHDDPDARRAAPVLAVWNGRELVTAHGQPALAGYGGDICARAEGGFLVSCTRAHQVALFGAGGQWQNSIALEEACALGEVAGTWWAAGRLSALGGGGTDRASLSTDLPAGSRIDNHWLAFG